MSRRYFEDELAYLREVGKEFAEAHPDVAHLLSGPTGDPSVARLLEDTAFLTARIREKYESELPELSHSVLGLLWPHYLRLVPAMAIVEFGPASGAAGESVAIPTGTRVESVAVEGTRCTFSTCYDVQLQPVSISEVEVEDDRRTSILKVAIRLAPGMDLSGTRLDSLRFHLHGEGSLPATLLTFLMSKLESVKVQTLDPDVEPRSLELPKDALQPVGFAEEEALLPDINPAFRGYRLLQEYFALPSKFCFIDVEGLARLSTLGPAKAFEFVFRFSERLETSTRVTKEAIRLGCTPVVNLFRHNIDPFVLDHQRVEYRLRPSGRDPSHHEIFSIHRVQGTIRGTARRREYRPLVERISLGRGGKTTPWYDLRIRPAAADDGTETWLAFEVPESLDQSAEETVSIEALCTNRNLPGHLRAGDISLPTANTPSFVKLTNLSSPTLGVPPPRGRELHWRLIGQLALSRRSLATVETLRTLLTLYNFRALVDEPAWQLHNQRMSAITSVSAKPLDWLMGRYPMRGIEVRIGLKESVFGSEGDVYLFGMVLDHFVALWSTINSFSRLVIEQTERRKEIPWPPRLGDRPLA
jgi:type VI secretion system protein ImpG